MNTAIYIRVSTEEQVRDGFSINAQKDKLTMYSKLNDWNIINYYIDDGISGKNLTDRPAIMKLIKDIENGLINNVLIYKLDRLTRSMKDLIYLIELFEKYNCTFNSETEKIDTSNAVGRMFIKIIGIFAEFERENLAERVTLGYEQKTKEGNYTNTNGIFGYDYIVGENKFIVNNLESEYVNKIYKWYLNGESMTNIIKKLNVLKIPTKRGGNWNISTIRSILSNPTYIGKIRYGVHKKNKFITDAINIKPIISEELFNAVNTLHSKRYINKSRKYSSDDTYYFKVLKCAKCGGKMHARQQIQCGKKYITYECNGRGNSTCDAYSFSHMKLENSFITYLDKIKNFTFEKNIITDKNGIDNTSKINDELNNINKKKEEIINLFTNNLIDFNTYQKMFNNILDKENNLNNTLSEINENKEQFNINDLKKVIVNIKSNFINLTNHEKKIFLERFINNIEVIKINNDVIIKKVTF